MREAWAVSAERDDRDDIQREDVADFSRMQKSGWTVLRTVQGSRAKTCADHARHFYFALRAGKPLKEAPGQI